MKKKMIIFVLFIVVIGFTIIYRASSHSNKKDAIIYSVDFPVYENIYGLTDAATDIVRGKITDRRVEKIDVLESLDDSQYLVYTVYTLLVSEAYKGNYVNGEYIEIKQLGGEIDEIIILTDNRVELHDNNQYIFFLESYTNIPASMLNPVQGVFIYENGSGELSEKLNCASGQNDLSLTYHDLLKIANGNR